MSYVCLMWRVPLCLPSASSAISFPAETDVFKTSSGRLKKVTASYGKTRRRHDAWKKTSDLWRLEDFWFMPSWRCPIYNVLKTFYVFSDLRHLEDVQFGTSWKRLITTSSGLLIYDVLKTSDLHCLEDVQFTTSWRHLIYGILKTSVKRSLCSNVVATSTQRRMKLFFLILHCLKYSENFNFSSLG